MRGCGFAKWEVEAAKLYNDKLTPHEFVEIQQWVFDLRENNPIQKHDVFLSCSHANASFVDALEKKLHTAGINFDRDIHHAKAGRMDKNVEHGMRSNPIVIVVLSKASLESDWGEREVDTAAKLSNELKRDVLCPITLDESWKTCDWNGPLRSQIKKYNILDFSRWETAEERERVFRKLIDGLDLFYRPSRETSL